MTAQLQEADMNIMSPAQCEATWGVSHREDIHICVVDENNQQGSCNVGLFVADITCEFLK